MKLLPVGSEMYMDKDIDSQWNVKDGTKPRVVTKSEEIYVDEYGQPYRKSADGTLFPMSSYVMAFEPDDMVPTAATAEDDKMEAFIYDYAKTSYYGA